MSDPLAIIRRITKKKRNNMENFENAIIDNTVASEHPVLQSLKAQISNLESLVSAQSDAMEKSEQRIREIRQEKWKYEERVKNVLTEAVEDHDLETIKHIADNLDIELTKTATYEVNVTFTIEVEHSIDSEVDPDWDFDFAVSHEDIVDYSSDVIWSNKTS
jgi:DNA repair ATPase RecN